MNAPSAGSGALMRRAVALIFMLYTFGEIGVGAALVTFPQVAALLLDMQLEASALFVARGLGVAVLALSITWWTARSDPQHVAYCAAGFILYNLGVGVLFTVAAVAASRPALPSFVAAIHFLVGGGLGAALLLRPSERMVN